MYQRILKKLDIKKEDVKLIGIPFIDDACTAYVSIIDVIKHRSNKSKIIWGLYIPRKFYFLNEEKQDGVLAHELGHCKRNLRFNDINKFEKTGEWKKKHMILDMRGLLTEEDRLTKWHRMKEIDADNWAIKAGEGLGLLQHLKDRYKQYSFNPMQKSEVEARIANLEQKLRVEK